MKIFLFSFILFLFFNGCNKSSKPVYDEIYTVKTVNLHDVLSITGEVRPIVKIDLQSEASGKIQKVFIKEGQQIYKGDTVLLIDPSRLNTQKKKLLLAISEAEIEFNKSRRDYIDGKELQYNGSLSEKRLFDLQMKYQLDSINLKRQMLDLSDIQDELNKTIITSPMSGVVTNLPVEAGEIAVSATSGFQSGTEIATIADISKLEIITSISEVDYIHIKTGQSVLIKPQALQNSQTKGTISFIALNAKKDNTNELSGFEVRVIIDSIIPGIAPGINVTLSFTIKEKANVIGVPSHFIINNDSLYYVNKIISDAAGKFSIEKKAVSIGETDYRYYEITSGLNVGDSIAILPSNVSPAISEKM